MRRPVALVAAGLGACACALVVHCTPFGDGNHVDGGTTADAERPDGAAADSGLEDGAVDPCKATLTERFDGDIDGLLQRWPESTKRNGSLSLVPSPAVSSPGALAAKTTSGSGEIDVALVRTLGRCPKVKMTFSIYADVYGGEPDVAAISIAPAPLSDGSVVETAYVVVRADAAAKELQLAEYSNAFGYHFVQNWSVPAAGWVSLTLNVDTRAGTFRGTLNGMSSSQHALKTSVDANAVVGVALGVSDYVDPMQSLTVYYDDLTVETE